VLLLLPDFDIASAHTVAEACDLLHRHGGDASVIAGGTDLLVKMKYKRTLPRYLVNVKGIPDLDQIQADGNQSLRIGALATMQSIKDSPIIARELPLLHQAAGKMGTLHIRNMGTLGGNLANASPSAECAPALLTHDASVRCVGPGGERLAPIQEFFVGPGKTILHHDELLIEICVPKLPAHAAGVYLKHSLRSMEVAIASAAVVAYVDDSGCVDTRIALGAVAPTPFRARKAEAAINGRQLRGARGNGELFEEVARAAAEESTPIDDIRGSAAQRTELVALLVKNGLEQAVGRAMEMRGRSRR
jgi:carbon-monoxide dehydrogenase medium subunit